MMFDSRTRFRQTSDAGNHRPLQSESAKSAEFDLAKTIKPVDEWIGRHPALCLGIAVAAGVTLGCFVKRR